jgi:branched-chain amino acid transport system substrate-binding protein
MSRIRNSVLVSFAAAGLVASAGLFAARADTIHVGVTLSSTGPAASLGIPQRNTIALLPRTVDGQTMDYTVLDDGGDPTRAVANMRKLIDEDHADAIIGSSTTPASMAMIAVAAEKKVLMISLAASASLIAPMDAQRRWVFKVPQNDSLMADAIAGYMQKHGVHTVGFIGFNDAYGDGWATEFGLAAKAHALKIVDSERFARNDTSVTGQALKLIAAHPDAILIAGAGTPAALPQKALHQLGYKGHYYQTHGVANNDFLRVGGKDVEGTVLPAGPILVAAQLPDSNPIKAHALDYIHRYEAAYGAGSVSTFGGHAYDAATLLAAAIPSALKQGKPGTEAFRAGLRSGMEEQHDLVLVHGIATLSPTDHNGFDDRARVMVTIKDGHWKLLP